MHWTVRASAGLLGVLACATSRPVYTSHLGSVTSYSVKTPSVTPGGVRYGGKLDPAFLDRVTKQVAVCLASLPEPTDAEKTAMDCPPIPLRRDVDVRAFEVLEAPDWAVTKCSLEQTFPCKINPQGCIDKGQSPTQECPCRCRATVQDGRTVVVTPNLRLYPGELVRLVTACNSPWTVDGHASPLTPCLVPPQVP